MELRKLTKLLLPPGESKDVSIKMKFWIKKRNKINRRFTMIMLHTDITVIPHVFKNEVP